MKSILHPVRGAAGPAVRDGPAPGREPPPGPKRPGETGGGAL